MSIIIIGAALLLICCGDPEAKARKLLNDAQVLEYAGKEQEAQQLLHEVVKRYPQTIAATTASQLFNRRRAPKDLLSSVLAANEASALARMRTIGTAQLIHWVDQGEFGSLEALADVDLLPGMSDGVSAGYKFRSAPGSDAALNFTASAEPVQDKSKALCRVPRNYQVKCGRANFGWKPNETRFHPSGHPHWSTTDGVTNAGLGLALEILTQRHCATNLLGEEVQSRDGQVLLTRVEGMQSTAWDGCWRERGAGGETCPSGRVVYNPHDHRRRPYHHCYR